MPYCVVSVGMLWLSVFISLTIHPAMIRILYIVYSDLAQVQIAESQYSILYGGSVHIQCSVGNAVPPVTALRWYKGTSVNNINVSVDVTTSRFSGGVLDNPSLNITNVVPSDEGYYSCNATNLVGIASAWTFLDVYGGMFTFHCVQ